MPSDSGQVEAKSDCADLLQQARTAHIALLAASFVFLVFALAPSQSDLETAHQQSRDIKELCHEWDTRGVMAYLSDRIARLLRQNKLSTGQDIFRLLAVGTPGQSFLISIAKPAWVLLPEGPIPEPTTSGRFMASWKDLTGTQPASLPSAEGLENPPADLPRSFPAESVLTSSPSTLKMFRQLWDAIAKPTRIEVPRRLSGQCYKRYQRWPIPGDVSMSRVTRKPKARQELLDCPVIDADIYSEKLYNFETLHKPLNLYGRFHAYTTSQRQDAAERFSGFPYHTYLLAAGDDTRGEFWFFPVAESFATTDDLQQALISLYPERWRHGRFEYSFEELNEVAGTYEDLDLDTIVKIVGSEKKRRGPTVDVFGAHLPTESTGWWGMLVIIGLLAYLCVHMKEMRRRACAHKEPLTTAWIALYPFLGARILFVVSVAPMPVGVILLLARRVGSPGLPRGLAASGVIIAAALGLAAWWNAPRPNKAH